MLKRKALAIEQQRRSDGAVAGWPRAAFERNVDLFDAARLPTPDPDQVP